MEPASLAFDLVVASVNRVSELRHFLDSVERQSHRSFRVILVDQNPDDRLLPVVAERSGLDVVHVRAPRGLSRARNVGLEHVRGDVVAFPDDDCVYPEDLLERVAGRLVDRPDLDGVCGRVVDAKGRSSPSWAPEPATLSVDNLWNRANSISIFLRSAVIGTVGRFDEGLGLGSGSAWSSGEEIDYLIRSVRAAATIEYDPALTVIHDDDPLDRDRLRAIGYRDGASIGYLLRKHHYPPRIVGRMAVRPVGGALVALGKGDVTRARFHAATLRGRAAGYFGSGRASGR